MTKVLRFFSRPTFDWFEVMAIGGAVMIGIHHPWKYIGVLLLGSTASAVAKAIADWRAAS